MKFFLKKSLLLCLLLFFSGSVFSQKTIVEYVDDLGNKYVKKEKIMDSSSELFMQMKLR
jgi:hypothetical protein